MMTWCRRLQKVNQDLMASYDWEQFDHPSYSSNVTFLKKHPKYYFPCLCRCTLPAYPEHGSYTFTSPGSVPLGPGDEVVQFTILRYSCDAGYEISVVVNVCGETKTWSREPYCKREFNHCL